MESMPMGSEKTRKFGRGDWIMLLTLLIVTGVAILAGNSYLNHQPARVAAYADHVSLLQAPVVQQALHDPSMSREQADQRAMALIETALSQFDSPYSRERERHPISMQTLQAVAPQIIELQMKGENLESYILKDGRIIPVPSD